MQRLRVLVIGVRSMKVRNMLGIPQGWAGPTFLNGKKVKKMVL